MPLVLTGDENIGLRQLNAAFVFEVIIKKFQLGSPVMFTRTGSKVNIAKVFPISSCPLSMRPRSHHQAVGNRRRVLFFNGLIGMPGAPAILGIEQAAYRHYRRFDIGQVWQRVPGLPEIVIVRMAHHLIPEYHGVAKDQCRGIFQGAQFQEKIVVVLPGDTVARLSLPGRLRTGLAEGGIEPEGIQLGESAVVVKIIPNEPIGNGCLWRNCFQCRMCIYQRHGGIKTRVRNAQNAYSAVIVGYVLYQPVDGIIGVAAFVNIFAAFFRGL